jgi:hypothetical protein
VSLESSQWGGVHGLGSMTFGLAMQKFLNIEWSFHWAWFHDIWTCCTKVLEYWMISSLKIKLNHSWNFLRIWNVPSVLLERSWWAGFNEIYLVRVLFRMWEVLIFRVISASNKFQKTKFWKEKSVENVVTLEGLPFSSSMISFHIWLFKKLQNNVHMLSLPIL